MSEIFLINEGEILVPLAQKAYDSEDLLQTLLEKYPSLLAGDQVNPKAPRRWLLVKREAGVPGEEKGSGRWSLDHLFLDQDPRSQGDRGNRGGGRPEDERWQPPQAEMGRSLVHYVS
jgi:hypothetical protein